MLQASMSPPAPAPDTPHPRESDSTASTSSPTAEAAKQTATPSPSSQKPPETPKPNGGAKVADAKRTGSGGWGWGELRGKSLLSPRTPKTLQPQKSEEAAFRESLPKLRSISKERKAPAPKDTPEQPAQEAPGNKLIAQRYQGNVFDRM